MKSLVCFLFALLGLQQASTFFFHYDPYRETRFYLYTPSNPSCPQRLRLDDSVGLNRSSFDATRPTRLLTHGMFASYRDQSNVQAPIAAYLRRGAFNLVAVDWSAAAMFLDLQLEPVARAWRHGEVVARFVDFLSRDGGLETTDLVLIGHSLGAQVMAFAAKAMKSGRPQAIVALDPVGPMFNGKRTERRLDRSDAEYVEVIHTNADGSGCLQPLGHADFYPAGGRIQPGCSDMFGVCSHLRAGLYFAESIERGGFSAKQCKSVESITSSGCEEMGEGGNGTVKMGGEPLEPKEGVFWVQVCDHAPFSKDSAEL